MRGQKLKQVIKIWVVIAAGGFIVVGLVWWGYPYALAKVPVFLVVDEPLIQPADVIIVTSGSLKRIQYAAVLYRKGFARTLLINVNPEDFEFVDEFLKLNLYDLFRKSLAENGVPEHAILYDPRSTSTYEDALNSRDQVVRHGWRSAIVVSHPLHMRRVAWSFRNVFANLSVTLKFKALPLKVHMDSWWTREQELVAVNNEMIKLLLYWFKYS